MDLYFLNFKRIIVVLTDSSMRTAILNECEQQEIDVNIKFVDSYFDAATLINENKFDPYDHLLLKTGFSNKKLKDFLGFVQELMDEKEDYLLDYSLLFES